MKAEKVATELQEQVSTKGAAKFLGVSDRTIQNYRKAGILTPQAFGKDFSALYTKGQLIEEVKRSSKKKTETGDKLRKVSETLHSKGECSSESDENIGHPE